MCGIAGILKTNGKVRREDIAPMLSCQSHRGPEQEGVWQSREENVVLGHRRLAIIDLSPGGAQPRLSPDGSVVITFNGEIYNYLDLKEELKAKGHQFVSKSDTEVLLHAYLEWGPECLERINGMFAFAVWDENKKTLFAARDRLGEKPFKYYFDNERFIFASEVKAILKDTSIKKEVDWQAIDAALSLRFVPAPYTGFKNIWKLPAGHYLTWQRGEVEINKYWDAADHSGTFDGTERELETHVWDTFKDSVRRRLISDVPVGSFLSGGLDSTSVVAGIREVSKAPLATFVISFDGQSEDRKYAGVAAKYFKTDHHEIEISDIDFEEALKKLSFFYDEPFFDQSALPSLLINEHIKKYVTVALSGDGSDELFGGYSSYRFARIAAQYHRLPKFVYEDLVPALAKVSNSALYRSEIMARDFYGSYSEYYSLWKDRLPLSGRYITKSDLYRQDSGIEPDLVSSLMKSWFPKTKDIVNAAMIADIRSRLPDGYLAKIDFAAMASAVEVRPPFLDHRLVELAQKIPGGQKIRRTNKYIWKNIVKGKIPDEIIARPKTGFALPLHTILMKELKPFVESVVLSKDALMYQKFSFDAVKKMWADHKSGKADYSNHIWSLLILEMWLRQYVK